MTRSITGAATMVAMLPASAHEGVNPNGFAHQLMHQPGGVLLLIGALTAAGVCGAVILRAWLRAHAPARARTAR